MADKLRFRHPRFVEFVDGFCRLRKWGPGELDGTIRVLRRMGGIDIADTLKWMARQNGLNDGEVMSNVIIRPWRGQEAIDRDIRRWRRTPRTHRTEIGGIDAHYSFRGGSCGARAGGQ